MNVGLFSPDAMGIGARPEPGRGACPELRRGALDSTRSVATSQPAADRSRPGSRNAFDETLDASLASSEERDEVRDKVDESAAMATGMLPPGDIAQDVRSQHDTTTPHTEGADEDKSSESFGPFGTFGSFGTFESFGSFGSFDDTAPSSVNGVGESGQPPQSALTSPVPPVASFVDAVGETTGQAAAESELTIVDAENSLTAAMAEVSAEVSESAGPVSEPEIEPAQRSDVRASDSATGEPVPDAIDIVNQPSGEDPAGNSGRDGDSRNAARELAATPNSSATAPREAPVTSPMTMTIGAMPQPATVHATTFSLPIEAAPAATPAPDTADRLIQSLKMQYARGGGDAVVHIKPEHLGPLSVAVRVEQGIVTAIVNASDPAVVEWLKANHDSLREGLNSQGLHLERLFVTRDGSDRSRQDWQESQRRAQRRRMPRPESTFEIAV